MKLPLPCLLAIFTAGCQTLPPPADFPPLEIDIAHVNDTHSHLEPHPGFEIRVDGVPTRVEAGGFPRLTALFKEAERLPNLLKVHAGDAMTGTLFHTVYKGEADAALMNTVCFDVFELGNHEFDEGDGGLRKFLDHLGSGPCRTEVLAANVRPAPGTPAAGRLKPYVVKAIGGVRVGIVGIEVKGKTMNSSRPLPTTAFDDETTTAQRYIDELKGQGIRHIILVTHQGYEADKAMAAQLTDVDAIIGGDSHTLLGDFNRLGLTAAGPYPTVTKNRDGDPVCIGQAWEYTKAFALMQVRFDPRGAVASCSGAAALPLGDDFRQRDASGAFIPRPEIKGRLAGEPAVRIVAPDPQAQAQLQRFSTRLAEMKQQKIGVATQSLCLVRVPGEATNRSGGVPGCEAANTLARGSDIAQAVAEAYRQASKLADIALQNGGGIRTPLPRGEVTVNTAYTVLPFSNTLIEMKLTGREIREVLEEAVANHLDRGGSDGSHPYAAGLRWDLDLSKPAGRRFSSLEIRDRATVAWQPLDPDRSYTVVTSDYLASGGDGYRQLAAIHGRGQSVNTYLHYTQTFVEYLQARGTIARPPAEEYSHKSVVAKNGGRLAKTGEKP